MLTRRIFAPERDSPWHAGARLPEGAAPRLLRRLRARDVALLRLLLEHRFLETGHVQTLLFGSSAEVTRRRLRFLKSEGLVARWRQLEPVGMGYLQHDSVWTLTDRGAATTAALLERDVKEAIHRSNAAAEGQEAMRVAHHLAAVGFFVSLVAASRELPDQGLLDWLSDDEARSRYQEAGSSIAPDGIGTYLMADRTHTLMLELDMGTEPLRRIEDKGRAYLDLHGDPGDRTRVLWIAPTPRREDSMNRVLSALPGLADTGRFATTHRALVEADPLGAVWKPAKRAERFPLARTKGFDRDPEDKVEHCLGRPEWWKHW